MQIIIMEAARVAAFFPVLNASIFVYALLSVRTEPLGFGLWASEAYFRESIAK